MTPQKEGWSQNEDFLKMKMTQKLNNYKNEDNPENEETPKDEDNLKNLDDLKNEDDPKILDNLKDKWRQHKNRDNIREWRWWQKVSAFANVALYMVQTAVVYVALHNFCSSKLKQEIWIFIPIKCQILWPLHDIEDESLAGGYK